MAEEVTIGKRGIITLPAKLRRKYGLEQNDRLLVEESPQGLLLRPTVSIPIELYTEKRIREFEEESAGLDEKLDVLGIE